MNLNYAKVTFHCGDLSVVLLELAVLPQYHGHAYWQPFPSQKKNKQEKKIKDTSVEKVASHYTFVVKIARWTPGFAKWFLIISYFLNPKQWV